MMNGGGGGGPVLGRGGGLVGRGGGMLDSESLSDSRLTSSLAINGMSVNLFSNLGSFTMQSFSNGAGAISM